MKFWDEFKDSLDNKSIIVILVSVLVSTLATALSIDVKLIPSFEPTIIFITINLLLLVICCFGLAISAFFIIFELIPTLLSGIGETFAKKVEKHGLAKVLFFLLLAYVILNKLGVLP